MFNLDRYLTDRRNWIERQLSCRLPVADAKPALLSQAVRHAILVGGKRLRPVLCLASAEAAGGNADTALPAALAVELLHGYTLVHDDLPCMDDDVERRGQPTVHVAFGQGAAVLAGDALQAMAFGLLAETPEPRPGTIAEMLRSFAQAAFGVVAGQVEDIRENRSPDPETIRYVHAHKTADLFEAALRLGALATSAMPEAVERLATYGRELGMAFQIQDDLLDDPANTPPGRPPEFNCLLVMSTTEARAQASRHTQAAMQALVNLPGPVEPLQAIAERLLNRSH